MLATIGATVSGIAGAVVAGATAVVSAVMFVLPL